MAYKFQLGAARLSGSVIQTDGDGDLRATTVDSLDVSSGGIANAGAIAGATTIAASGLSSLASISVDDGSTIGPDSVADLITLSADGDFTFKDGAYDLNIASHDGTNGLALGGVIVAASAAELNLLDTAAVGTVVNSKAVIYSGAGQVNGTTLSASSNVSAGGSFFGAGIGLADASGIAGTGIDNNEGELQVAAAQTLIESITNNALLLEGNGSMKLDLATSAVAKFKIGADDKMLISASGVTIPGNLTVQGTTTTIDSTTINISKSFTFEGDVAGDSATTVLDSGLPTANTTVKLPTLAAGTYHLPVLADAPTAASALVTAAEFAVLDGDDSATSVTIADSDQMILNDAGTMIQIAMSDVKTYAGGAAQVLEVAIVADGASLVADKLQYVADRDGVGQNVGLTLPASAAGLVGKSIYIKAGNLENSAKITVATAAGDQKIDGVNSIILESPFASVRLIYVTTDQWRVF